MLFKSYVPCRASNVGQTQITHDKVFHDMFSTNITQHLGILSENFTISKKTRRRWREFFRDTREDFIEVLSENVVQGHSCQK